MDSREASSGEDHCLDSRLWYACAGSMVQIPSVNSKVFYFPQGHSEHALGSVDFRNCPRTPARIPCRVTGIKFMADRVTDEVFAKIRLVPISGNEMGLDDEKSMRVSGSQNGDKHTSFAKTLTQSDANNGGGFSVPRYCAETIFPSLDYTNDPPVQTIVARDVHGEIWKFRHIYRGTPRRHLLTTGWSIFVNHKSLVAGDSVVFMRGENSDVYLGIRRAKKGIGGGLETPTWWNSASGNSGTTHCLDFSPFCGEGEAELGRHVYTTENRMNRGRVKAEDVVQAATLAANGQPFDVIYYPCANTPEFCVKASQVIAALRIQWSPGMRFKMPFETEDSSRISWFMGTISSVQVADPVQWPDSPWRLLQVTWDEPDLLQNVKRVSPWLVELVPDIPSGLLSFSSPRKRLRSPHQEFPVGGKILLPSFSSHPVLPPNNIFGCLPITTPGSIQGARHAQYGFPTPYFHSSEQPSVCFRPLVSFSLPCQDPIPEKDENVSCLLSIGNSAQESIKSDNSKAAPAPFVLFGKPILTDKQISQLCYNDSAAISLTQTSNTCDVSGSCFDVNQNKASFPSTSPSSSPPPGLDGLCKVFLESEDVGRTLDLSSVDCYEDVRLKLKDLFGIQVPETPNLIIYRDAAGTVRQLGDEPFRTFVRSARRLTVLTNISTNARV